MNIVFLFPRTFSHGVSGFQRTMEGKFGKWWPAAWFVAGALGFCGWVATVALWMPGGMELPSDKMGWAFVGLIYFICLAGGPITLGGLPLVFSIFAVCAWLSGHA